MSHSYKQMADTYQKHTDLNLDSRSVMTRLIGRLVLNMKSAKEAHSHRNLEAMTEWNVKSLKILSYIRVSLNENQLKTPDAEALALAAKLRRMYQDIHIRLTNVLLAKDPQAEFDYFTETLRDQYNAWASRETEHAIAHKAPPATTQTQTEEPPLKTAYFPAYAKSVSTNQSMPQDILA